MLSPKIIAYIIIFSILFNQVIHLFSLTANLIFFHSFLHFLCTVVTCTTHWTTFTIFTFYSYYIIWTLIKLFFRKAIFHHHGNYEIIHMRLMFWFQKYLLSPFSLGSCVFQILLEIFWRLRASHRVTQWRSQGALGCYSPLPWAVLMYVELISFFSRIIRSIN